MKKLKIVGIILIVIIVIYTLFVTVELIRFNNNFGVEPLIKTGVIDSYVSTDSNLSKEKMYSNVEEYGNTFCASIPIALDDMFKQNKLKENDKVILIGYGGGLNTGSILMEI